ncbi:MAG: type I DNA topoisomerase [Desulforegulaceae bacterium]|nr:type I DNA topoisomerase [Desulforegulaceae bacterium]
MSKPLLIVESPTKVRTLKKYIGKDFDVTATAGHIKDLPPKKIGIDIENNFTPEYQVINGKQKTIKALKDAAKDKEIIYLAPDPDREGEAIAFHTAEILKKKNRKFYRILLHELTKNGIEESIKKPLELDKNKFDAQQTRRILDRLVGYQISPLLWKKIQRGLSAGRVQSVSVRMICEREREIQAFEPEEYWHITALLAKYDTKEQFEAKLTKKNQKKIKITDENTSNTILNEIENKEFIIEKIKRKTINKTPQPPFITSKMQQDSITKLRFSAQKTMTLAQQLYEGIELGNEGHVGLITYMRTDSIRVSKDASDEAFAWIKENLGNDFAPKSQRIFTNKNKAQDAHEAIRPTSVFNTPEKIKNYLNKDQFALYELIWKRFVASQMSNAIINQVSCEISAGDYTFSASGSTTAFMGYMAVYQNETAKAEDSKELPPLDEKEKLLREKITPSQHFTQPPPRYTEASLVKALEENGIGRPSTYATILSTIKNKGYVVLENRKFYPTELGIIVTDLLVDNFPEILNVDFTAKFEDDLDKIEHSELDLLDVLNNFYKRFEKNLTEAEKNMLSIKGVGLSTGIKCPECKKGELKIKVGKNGPFIACDRYPDCTFSSNYERDEKGSIKLIKNEALEAEIPESDKICPKCGKPMVIKQGKFGPFLACSGYPECKYTQSLANAGEKSKTGVKCPEPGCSGELVEKRSRRGKVFYGCSKFPDCSFALWDKPVNKKCPLCNSPFLVEKETKKEGKQLKCINKECGYKQKIEDDEDNNSNNE